MSEDNDKLKETELESPDEQESKIPEEWDSLGGKAQERFQKMIEIKNQALEKQKELERENELLKTRSTPAPAPTPRSTDDLSYEEKIALERLRKVAKVMTQDDVKEMIEDVRRQTREERDRALLDSEHNKLEGKYSTGSYPAYDRAEVEQYMSKMGIYDPEAAYFKLYKDEIIEAEKQNVKAEKPNIPTRTRSKISAGEPWTPEMLSERLAAKDGREWYVKNRDMVNSLYDSWRQGE